MKQPPKRCEGASLSGLDFGDRFSGSVVGSNQRLDEPHIWDVPQVLLALADHLTEGGHGDVTLCEVSVDDAHQLLV